MSGGTRSQRSAQKRKSDAEPRGGGGGRAGWGAVGSVPTRPDPISRRPARGHRAEQGQLHAVCGGSTATPAPGEPSDRARKGTRGELTSPGPRREVAPAPSARRETPGVVRQGVSLQACRSRPAAVAWGPVTCSLEWPAATQLEPLVSEEVAGCPRVW